MITVACTHLGLGLVAGVLGGMLLGLRLTMRDDTPCGMPDKSPSFDDEEPWWA